MRRRRGSSPVRTVSARKAPAPRYVPRGGNLQQALNAANPGDTILLEAGAAHTGNFLLRAKQGDAAITIASRALDALPEGVRVTTAASKFATPNTEPVLRTEARARDCLVTPAAAYCVVRLLGSGRLVRMNPLYQAMLNSEYGLKVVNPDCRLFVVPRESSRPSRRNAA